MDWSSDLKRLFVARQTINNASASQEDKNKAKAEENKILATNNLLDINGSGNVDIEDLIALTTIDKGSPDDNSEVSDEENSFFDSVKELLYDTLAKGINRNKDLNVDDMVALEKQIRELDDDKKEVVGEELNKLQNRMVSNLTSQFFVNNETDAYKEKATTDMLEILNAKVELNNSTGDNPFAPTKTEDLLNKLESRVTRTLEEDYSTESVKTFKQTQNVSSLVKRSDAQGEDDQNLEFKDGILYDGDKKFSGIYKADGKCYEDGVFCSGISSATGGYYINGGTVTGNYPYEVGTSPKTEAGMFHVENSKIIYEDKDDDVYRENTVRTYFESYAYTDKNGFNVPAMPKTVITFKGKVETGKADETGIISTRKNYENGKLVSTEIFAYNEDGSKAIKTVYEDKTKQEEVAKYQPNGDLFDGQDGVYNGKLYVGGEFAQGIVDEKLYENGELVKGSKVYEGTLFVDGEKLTGIHKENGIYYEDGLIKEKAVATDGKVYFNGIPANGVTLEECKYNYYEDGIKKAEVDNEDVGEFIKDNNIANVKFEKTDDGYDFNKFNGVQNLDGAWRRVDYELTDSENYTQTVSYETDIILVNTFENGILKDAKYKLGEMIVDVPENNSEVGIDYSLRYIDVDGAHPVVEISYALTNGITKVINYNKTETGYTKSDEQIVIGSIDDIQKGKILTAYNIDDENISITPVEGPFETLTVTDTRATGITVVQEFNADGTRKSGKIDFAKSGVSDVVLDENSKYRIKDGKVIVISYNKADCLYTVTTYNADGIDGEPDTIEDTDGKMARFANSIGMNISEMANIETNEESGKVTGFTYDGVTYAVTYDEKDENKITITSEEPTKIKTFKNGVVIFEQYEAYGSTITIERNEEGIQTRYKSATADDDYSEYKYDGETGNLSQKTFAHSDGSKTVISYAPDGKTVIETSETDKDGNETKYAGPAGGTSKIIYRKVVEEDKTTETTYDIETGKQKSVSTTVGNQKTTITYADDGTKELTKKVTTFEGGKEKYTEIWDLESNRISQKDTPLKDQEGNIIGKTVETYEYIPLSSIINQTTTVTYNLFDIVQQIEVTDNINNRLTSRTVYENGMKSSIETFDYYYDDNKPKTSTVEEFFGETRVKVITRTYDTHGGWIDKVNDSIVGNVDKDGDEITEQQRQFAQNVGLTITDVEYNADGSLKTIAGTRYGSDLVSIYSNWTVSNGKYSYTEETVFSNNNSVPTDDDIVLITQVKDDKQQSARMRVGKNETTYPVNVNGALINNNIDAQLAVYDIDGIANKVFVSDVINDGIVRQREFTLNPDAKTYSLVTKIALSTIENIQDEEEYAKIPRFEITDSTSLEGEKITVPVTDNKVTAYVGDLSYEIELKAGETFTIDKDGTITSQYKQGGKDIVTTYEFDENGYTKTLTKDDVELIYAYDNDNTLTKLTVGENEIDMTNATLSADGKSVSVTRDAVTEGENTKVGYELTYALEKDDTHNIGDITSGKIKFAGDDEYTLKASDKVKLNDDGTVTVTTKVNDNLTTSITRNAIGKYTEVKLNDVALAFDGKADSIVILSSGSEIKIQKAKTADTAGYEYVYSTATATLGNLKSFKLRPVTGDDVVIENVSSVSFDTENGLISVQETNGITSIFDNKGQLKQYKIGDSVFNSSGVTRAVEGKNIKFTRSDNSNETVEFELIYNTETKKLTGQLKNGSTTAKINEGYVLTEDAGYMLVKTSSGLKILNNTLDDLNSSLGLSYDRYKNLNEKLKEYNNNLTDSTKKITLKDVTAVTFNSDSVSVQLNSSISDVKEEIIIGDMMISKKYKIGSQTFNVPFGTTITSANNKITISYTHDDSTTTVELGKDKGTNEEEPTYYNKVKYNNGDVENIAASAYITIKNDGSISK